MMDKLSTALVLGAAVPFAAGCHTQQKPTEPAVVTVNVPGVDQAVPPPLEDRREPEKVIRAISDGERDQVFQNCYVKEPHKECALEELHLFFEMERQLDPAISKQCRPEGDYVMDCIEPMLQQFFGNDPVYQQYVQTKNSCRAVLEDCMDIEIGKLRFSPQSP